MMVQRAQIWTAAIEEMFGYLPERFLADPELWRACTHPHDRQAVGAMWARAREEGSAFAFEYRFHRADGRQIWIRDSAIPIRDGDGQIRFWQGLLNDVTAEKRTEQALREAEQRYRALVENIPAVVYMVASDDDRRTLYTSPQVERALGYSREEWLDQPDIWMELLHPNDREPTLAAHDEHNLTGEPWSREYRLIASDGRAVWFRDVATLTRDPQGHPLLLARGPACHHRAEARGRRASHREGRARDPRGGTHRRAGGGERPDVTRDRRAPARRGGTPRDRAAVPRSRRADPRSDLRLVGRSAR